MKKTFKYISAFAAVVLGLSACVGDLDVTPIDPNLVLLDDPAYLFNKCYANIALAGNGGANGDCDIDGLDGGTTGFVRQMWNANELTTDEAICGWGDEGISSFCYNSWDASHPMLRGYYYRLYAGITYCTIISMSLPRTMRLCRPRSVSSAPFITIWRWMPSAISRS